MNLIPRRAIGIGIFYTLISIAFPALAATNPPIKCRVLGETTIYKGKLYTCIRSRSKGKTILTWDSGKVIPVATTTSSQIPNPSVSPTPTASPPVIVKKIDIPIAKTSDLPNNSAKSFVAKNRNGNSTTYILIRKSDGLLALDATCPHQGCIVAVKSEGLLCPCHNALFDSTNGDVLRGPASYPLDRVAIYEADGVIYIND